jgi:hypothetical protein
MFDQKTSRMLLAIDLRCAAKNMVKVTYNVSPQAVAPIDSYCGTCRPGSNAPGMDRP